MNMEWNDRLALVRRAAGLTQEQLGELLGVTRQAVSKWESGQTVPDILTLTKLCQSLQVSADFILLGKEPENAVPAAYEPPDHCPCCGRAVSGSICPGCSYRLPGEPPRGSRYAVVATSLMFSGEEAHVAELEKYCGLPRETFQAAAAQYFESCTFFLLRRNLTDDAAHWITAHLDRGYFGLRIVEDCGEDDDALLAKPQAMELPELPKSSGIGFWGVVGAIIVALLILSFF